MLHPTFRYGIERALRVHDWGRLQVDIQVDHHVRYGRTPTTTSSLPKLDGIAEHTPAIPDRIGEAVRELRWLVAGGAAAGSAVLTTQAIRHGSGILGTAMRGMAGLGIGAAAVIGAGVLTQSLLGRSEPSSAPAASTKVQADEQLRVMTFNIHGAQGPLGAEFGGDAEIEAIARTIEQQRPDVVLLQEVNDFSIQNGHKNVYQRLVDRLDADGAVFTPGVENATGREFGNAVLTFNGTTIADARGLVHPEPQGDGLGRRTINYLDNFASVVTKQLTGTARTPFDTMPYRGRETSDVLVNTPAGNAVRVLSGHYSWPVDGFDAPRHQIDPLAKLLGAWDGPTLLGADFNVKSGTPDGDIEAAVLHDRAGLTDAFTEQGLALDSPDRGTFGEGPGGSRIDRIYASKQLKVTDANVIPFDPADGPASSDHRPLVVDYQLRAPDADSSR